MRLRLRLDAYPAAVDGGVAILTATGWVRFTGASVGRWIDALAPHLDGRHTLAGLTKSLAPPQREQVERLIAALRASGVVREVGEEVAADLTAAERREYAPEIAFLDHFRDSAAAAFTRYRRQRALVLGNGELLAALARATVISGVRWVRVVEVGGDEAVTAALATRDPAQQLVCDRRPELSEEAAVGLTGGADLVLHGFDWQDRDRATRLGRACARTGVPVIQVAILDGEAWVTPLGNDTSRGRDLPEPWTALRYRLTLSSDPPGAQPLERAVAAVLANQAVQRVFTTLTGAAAPDALRPCRIDLQTGASRHHTFVPHPYAAPAVPTSETEFQNRIAALWDGPACAEEEFSRLATQCADERLGVISLDEHGWAQRPLHVTAARVRMPVAPQSGLGYTVTATGFTYQAARCGAALRGLAAAASLLVDPRRLVGLDARPLFPSGGDPEALLRSLRSDPDRGAATWGALLDQPGDARLVPAADAFPLLAPGPLSARPPAGVAGGYDWREAVTRGLLAHCRGLTEAEANRGDATYQSVDLAAVELDATGVRCRELLARLGELPDTYDITGSLGVPTVACYLAGAPIASGTGMTAASAVSDGLLRVVRAVQARVHRQPGYAPAPGPAMAAERRGRRRSPLVEAPLLDTTALAARLRAAGRTPVAVPLDHDPGLARIAPYLVNVLLLDRSRA